MASRRHFLRWAALGTLLGALTGRGVGDPSSSHGLDRIDPTTPAGQTSYRDQMKRYITAASLAQAPSLDG